MGTFDVFQHALDAGDDAGTSGGDESQRPTPNPPASETLLGHTQVHSDITGGLNHSTARLGEEASVSILGAIDCNNQEIVRLQHSLTELKTANIAKELQLRNTQAELDNARHALSERFVEYTRLRDEIKTVKQTMAREHQSVVYRKDIELFALRKGNEQKERNIAERDARLGVVTREQKAMLESKDAQLKMLYERLAFLERQARSNSISDMRSEDSSSDGDHALEVRLLRVRKGKKSSTTEDDKDGVIAKLREDLAAATKTAEQVVNQQAELQRAWETAKKIQIALNEEKGNHTQTKMQLQEATTKLEGELQTRSRAASASRLPTIEENEQNELESMFDTAQQDNLRLYAEVGLLEKRLCDANARMFTAEQEVESLKEQLRLEKAINADMETARPSVVHRVHFQRMEGQLKEIQDAFSAKEQEVKALKAAITEKNQQLKDTQIELDAAATFHTQDQDEIDQLKLALSEIRIANEKLIREHERLASYRARHRLLSAEHLSARSSGSTLIPLDPSSRTSSSDFARTEARLEPVPVVPAIIEQERSSSIQETPKRHLRKQPSTHRETVNMISNDIPPAQLRIPSNSKTSKRRSMSLKGFMKRMVKKEKDTDVQEQPNKPVTEEKEKEKERQKHALADKNRNMMMRPKTSSSETAPTKPLLVNRLPEVEVRRPTTSTLPKNIRPEMKRRSTPRYYATLSKDDILRPQTSAGELKAPINGSERPSNRMSLGTS